MIHTELGEQLRRAREAKGLSLEEVEKATAIRKRFLQAMEEGRFDALPGEIQLRGFLRNYASQVGLNGDELLAVYERRTRPAQTTPAFQPATPVRPMTAQPKPSPTPTTASQPVRPAAAAAPAQSVVAPPPPAPPKAQPTPVSPPVTQVERALRLPAWLTLETVLIVIAAVLVICVVILLVLLLTNPGAETPSAAPRPIATRTRSAPPPPPTVPPETPAATPQPNITTSVKLTTTADFVQIALAATEHVWVRVTTDSKTAFEGMFAPGQLLKWEAKELVVVETGNGAGLNVSFNGKPVGALGPRNRLIARAWTPTGETAPPKPTPAPATPTTVP